MKESKTITVVMPVYCPGMYLRPCIESLLVQTFQDFRLIAIDDASPDGSYEILREYEKQDTRVLALRNPYRLGAARTRNIGIQMAQGTYLSVLDADDYFESDYLETMYRKLEETGADLAVCDFYIRDESLGSEYVLQVHPFIRSQMNGVISPADIKENLFQAFFTNPFTKMWRLSHVFSHGLQFQDIPNSNDVSFVQVGILAAETLAYVSRPLVHYRCHIPYQISATRGKSPLCIYEAIMKVYQYMQTQEILQNFRCSFYTWVIEYVIGEIMRSEGKVKKSAIQFMRQEGFRKLSMTDLRENDFRNVAAYRAWDNFFHQGIVKLIDEDFIYQRFFEKLKSISGKCALWGYGKLGKHFLEMAERLKFPVQEVYDCDASKWDASRLPPIKNFLLRDSSVDTIIYTNSRFTEEIIQAIRSEEAKVKLVDFSLFQQFNIIGTNRDRGGM